MTRPALGFQLVFLSDSDFRLTRSAEKRERLRYSAKWTLMVWDVQVISFSHQWLLWTKLE